VADRAAAGIAVLAGRWRPVIFADPDSLSRANRPVRSASTPSASVCLSFTPRLIAERVSIGNRLDAVRDRRGNWKDNISVRPAEERHSFDIANLEMQDVTLHLIRDSQGRATGS